MVHTREPPSRVGRCALCTCMSLIKYIHVDSILCLNPRLIMLFRIIIFIYKLTFNLEMILNLQQSASSTLRHPGGTCRYHSPPHTWAYLPWLPHPTRFPRVCSLAVRVRVQVQYTNSMLSTHEPCVMPFLKTWTFEREVLYPRS